MTGAHFRVTAPLCMSGTSAHTLDLHSLVTLATRCPHGKTAEDKLHEDKLPPRTLSDLRHLKGPVPQSDSPVDRTGPEEPEHAGTMATLAPEQRGPCISEAPPSH